jgi:hypothetical protein
VLVEPSHQLMLRDPPVFLALDTTAVRIGRRPLHSQRERSRRTAGARLVPGTLAGKCFSSLTLAITWSSRVAAQFRPGIQGDEA